MRMRQHVNPLNTAFERFRGTRPDIPEDAEVEVEIGCAEAVFLFERAERHPERFYIGVEIRRVLVAQVNERAAELDAPVVAVFANANRHLRELFEPRQVSRVYLNFPDPWFKKKHRKRRVIDADLAADIHWMLAPGGELFVQSDVWSVALDALDVFERADERFANMAGAWSFWKDGNPYGARSWREAHCEEDGLQIWRIRYAKRISSCSSSSA